MDSNPPAEKSLADAEVQLGAGFDFSDPNSRLARFYSRTGHIIAAVFIAAVFVFMTYVRVWHTDVWAHLRFGEYMATTRQLPEREMFSGDFADQEAPYINFQWLTQVGAYYLFDLGRRLAASGPDAQLGGGALMLSAAHAVIVSLRLLLLLLAFQRLTGSMRAALVGVVIAFVMALFSHLGILRPQILGELAFAALLVPLSRGELSRRALVCIPIVFALWVNVHGSFVVGLVLLGLFALGQAFAGAFEGSPAKGSPWRARSWSEVLGHWRSDRQLRRLLLVLASSAAVAAFLNPHGPALLWQVWRLANHPNIRFLEEWKPLPWREAAGIVFLSSVVVLAVVLLASPKRLSPTEGLLLLFFGWQTVAHARGFIWWAMVCPWVLTQHLHLALEHWRFIGLHDQDRPDLRKTILAVLAIGSICMWSTPAFWAIWGEAPSGVMRVTETTPYRASAYMRKQFEENPALSRMVFASETLGDYLIWDLRPTPPARITCYTHLHLLRPEHWLDCMAVKNGADNWQAVLDKNQVSFLMFEPDLHPRLAKRVREATEEWEIIPNMGPNLVAKRRTRAAGQ
jgi:hypothetical protein